MRTRFLADADLHQRIVIGLRRVEPEIDFETANVAAIEGVPDAEVLRRAAEKNRVLVSHDRRTMPSALIIAGRGPRTRPSERAYTCFAIVVIEARAASVLGRALAGSSVEWL